MSEKQQNNVHFIISNRAKLPKDYNEMRTSIEKRIGTKENGDPEYDAKYRKQVKKHIGGHEYFFLPNKPKSKFETSFKKAFIRIKIRDIRKRLHNSNIDPLAQLQENMETLTKENKLQIGKTGNSSTGEISDIHKQTAKTQIECAKQAIIQRR